MSKVMRRACNGIACVAAGCLALWLGGCAATSTVQVHRIAAQQFAPTSTVSVLSGAPRRAYVEIATLRVEGAPGDSAAQLLALLQARAAALGADALIVSNRSTVSTPLVGYSASGGTFSQPVLQQVPAFSAIAIRYLGTPEAR
jgi:hypothetical protein